VWLDPILIIGLSVLQGEALYWRLQSKPKDGKKVEPAPVEPEHVQVREARLTDRELARE